MTNRTALFTLGASMRGGDRQRQHEACALAIGCVDLHHAAEQCGEQPADV